MKLEFGNEKHIEMKKEYEEKNDPDKLRNYIVTFDISGSLDIEVEAVTEEEAKELAKEELENVSKYDKLAECEFDICRVEEIK